MPRTVAGDCWRCDGISVTTTAAGDAGRTINASIDWRVDTELVRRRDITDAARWWVGHLTQLSAGRDMTLVTIRADNTDKIIVCRASHDTPCGTCRDRL
ncbi:hypothetical protein N5T16_09460 [Escherichia coli]|nr:hypothetical protein [Escherichia coli]MCW3279132.1 hypothetical protein [Escherichia coli]